MLRLRTYAPAIRRAAVGRGAGQMLAVIATAVLATAAEAEVPAEMSSDRATALEHMVLQDCGSCHGLTLKGGLGRPLTREALTDATPEGLALIILDGVPGTAMPPWRPLLSEDEALWIATYLKTKD